MNVEDKVLANQTIGSSLLDDLFGDVGLENLAQDSTASLSASLGPSQIHGVEMAIDRFNYQDELGEGTYGKVWKAEDSDIGRHVAVKSYKLMGPAGLQLLSLETNIAGKIDHPGIPTLYDIRKTDEGQCHYIMRFIEGESLESIIEKLRENDEEYHEKYRFEQRVDIVIQILRVLSAAHKKNIIHRDIKPENIMIGASGEAYLMDWGVALDLGTSKGKGQLAGTPRYMSPEQAGKKELSPQSDLYATAVVLYEFLSLKTYGPEYENIEDLLSKLPTYQPDTMDLIKAHPKFGAFPFNFAPMLERGLKNDPAERYESAEEMLKDLEDAVSGKVEVSCPVTASFKLLSFLSRRMSVAPGQTFLLGSGLLFGGMASLVYIGTLIG